MASGQHVVSMGDLKFQLCKPLLCQTSRRWTAGVSGAGFGTWRGRGKLSDSTCKVSLDARYDTHRDNVFGVSRLLLLQIVVWSVAPSSPSCAFLVSGWECTK